VAERRAHREGFFFQVTRKKRENERAKEPHPLVEKRASFFFELVLFASLGFFFLVPISPSLFSAPSQRAKAQSQSKHTAHTIYETYSLC
jgi:hypothetical protein